MNRLTGLGPVNSEGHFVSRHFHRVRARGLLVILVLVALLDGSCFSPSTPTAPAPSTPTLTSIAVAPANPTIVNGSGQQFVATGHYSDGSSATLTTSVTWSSTAQNVATISNTAGSNGLATSVGSGSTTIQASLNDVNGSTTLMVSQTLVSIGVTPMNPTIVLGSTEQFTATGTYSDQSMQDLTNSVTWGSTSQGIATISNSAGSNGLATSAGVGSTTISATIGSIAGTTKLTVAPAGLAAVTTRQYDNLRTGQNTSETILTPSNVNVSQFGKLFTQPVDGAMLAQPLYVANVAIPGKGTHNVVFAATENDTVYAFDADNNTGGNATYLWKASMVDAAHGAPMGATAIAAGSFSCGSPATPTVGITSTPVIDSSTNTMYVVAFSQEGTQFVNRLHAIDITTGNEKSPGPKVIDATVSGTGDGSSNGQLTFSKLSQFIRPGLLLSNGTIYLASGALCEGMSPYHGWIFAYTASTFSQRAALVVTPNGGAGGMWMSGQGMAADSSGNIYVPTGNGTFDTTNVPATELGDTILKLAGSNLALLDYFTPWNQLNLDLSDGDVGSGGVLLLPDQPGNYPHLLIEAGKEGTIYVINRDQMTKLNQHYCSSGCNSDPQIAQELQGVLGGMWASPAYWNGNVYFWGQGDVLEAYGLTNGLLSTSPTSSSNTSMHNFGVTPIVSASGTTNGIVWGLASPDGGANEEVLYAYDATNVATELYDSNQAPNGRDSFADGTTVKFVSPIVANGKVYVGTATEIAVFGLLSGTP